MRNPFTEMNETEYKIWKKMLKYEKYFSDMRFEKKGLIRRFGKTKSQEDNGSWKTYYEDFPLEYLYLGIRDWFIKFTHPCL